MLCVASMSSVPFPSSKSDRRAAYTWDTPSIDHSKVDFVVDKDHPLPAPIEESSFAILFPRYREVYLRSIWPMVEKALKEYGVKAVLDLIQGTMTVSTTKNMWDPYMLFKARDFIKLLSRSVPYEPALKIFDDENACDIIKIGNAVNNKDRFAKRRQRLIGPNGSTLKAIELLTKCYVLVQGNTVSSIGPFKGLRAVRQIAEDCMKNIHPVYNIKTLMIKKELEKDPELAKENWDRFLPKFKKRNIKHKKVIKVKKTSALFPPLPTMSKVDLSLESGEYFLTHDQREKRALAEKKEKQEEFRVAKKLKRNLEMQPPEVSFFGFFFSKVGGCETSEQCFLCFEC